MLDHTDRRIIEELEKNGRISMKELGQLIHMTGQATANRVSKLAEEGIIEGYTIRLNQQKAGIPFKLSSRFICGGFTISPIWHLRSTSLPLNSITK